MFYNEPGIFLKYVFRKFQDGTHFSTISGYFETFPPILTLVYRHFCYVVRYGNIKW